LVSTGEAARALSIDRSTLGRWLRAGIVTAADRTAGGDYRWDVADLKRQLREQPPPDEPG
jgi:DNA-binding transcriptional MerR regulator